MFYSFHPLTSYLERQKKLFRQSILPELITIKFNARTRAHSCSVKKFSIPHLSGHRIVYERFAGEGLVRDW